MSEITIETTYFEKPGKSNTQRTLELALKRATELGIKSILVATTQGETAFQAALLFQGFEVITVTHSTGFKAPNAQELSPENRKSIEETGARVLTAQHAFGGVNRAVRRKLETYQLDEIIAFTLRIFCQGMKVAAEMALMAADAGLVRTDSPVMAIAGTGRGADTAVIVKPAHAQDFFDIKFLEVVCRPSPDHPGW